LYFRIGKADKCEYCNEPIVKIEGKFTGAYYTSDKNGKVHGECWHDYQVEHAEKCKYCNGPLMKIPLW